MMLREGSARGRSSNAYNELADVGGKGGVDDTVSANRCKE